MYKKARWNFADTPVLDEPRGSLFPAFVFLGMIAAAIGGFLL
jgi:hypothetical protein